MYVIVIYDQFGEELKRIPEKCKNVAKALAAWFTDDETFAVILEIKNSGLQTI